MPLREDSPLRTKRQTYPPAQVEMLKGVFTWFDDDYDKIPVERPYSATPISPARSSGYQ